MTYQILTTKITNPTNTMDKKETYSAFMHEDEFNWNEFLSQKNISQGLWRDAIEMANSWVTCACGNQCAIIPRDKSGQPNDEKLMRLGAKFWEDICRREDGMAEARTGLLAIENRSAYLMTLPDCIDPTQPTIK